MNSEFYKAFEEKYRGSREVVKKRLHVYLPFIEPLKKIYEEPQAIDLGCGRGEWLELLTENGFSALGIEQEKKMLSTCRKRDLNVQKADALAFLQKLPDDSYSVISGLHFAEHLEFTYLQKLVKEALRVLSSAGLLILETPNPENLIVGTLSFYLDPTHIRPIPPEMLAFLGEHYGFEKVKILRLQEEYELSENKSLSLYTVLTGVSPDYAMIAQKSADRETLVLTSDAFNHEYGITLDKLTVHYDQQSQKVVDTTEQFAAKVHEVDEKVKQLENHNKQTKKQLEEFVVQTLQVAKSIEQLTEQASQADKQAHLSEVRARQVDEWAAKLEIHARKADERAEHFEVMAQKANGRASQLEKDSRHAVERAERSELHACEADERAERSELHACEADERAERSALHACEADERAERSERHACEANERAERFAVQVRNFDEQVEHLVAQLQETKMRADQAILYAQEADKRAERLAAHIHEEEELTRESIARVREADERAERFATRVEEAEERACQSAVRAQEANERAEGLFVKVQEAEERVDHSFSIAQKADERAERLAVHVQEAEERAQKSTIRSQKANEHIEQLTAQVHEAEERAHVSALRAQKANERIEQLSVQVYEAEECTHESAMRARKADKSIKQLSEQLHEAEECAQQSVLSVCEADERAEGLAAQVQEAAKRTNQVEIQAQKADARVKQLEAQTKELETWAKQLEESAKRADEQAEQAFERASEVVLQQFYKSRSGRITAPLRWLAHQFRLVKDRGFIARVKALKRKTDSLNSATRQILAPKSVVLDLEQSSSAIEYLSSYTQGIYNDLQEILNNGDKRYHAKQSESKGQLKMAFVSPLPPQRSGISDYSAELLPELANFYDIDVIVEQNTVSDPWINTNCQIRSVKWFRKQASQYDRVLYHFGNSCFHQHMFSLLKTIKGVVVLHDFFLSDIVAQMDVQAYASGYWSHELYFSHGYKSVTERVNSIDVSNVIWNYPSNISVLRGAQGVIVHSDNSRKLVTHWYHTKDAESWSVIPLLRKPAENFSTAQARKILNLKDNDFIICSFGQLGPTKLNHRLLAAWIDSDLAKNESCRLIFVGENPDTDYSKKLLERINESTLRHRIHITGWVDLMNFRYYLKAADIGVQLRTLSRGETSAAVLDCLNYGLPVIVNAHGSMSDLDEETAWKLPDIFSNEQLVQAMETLWLHPERRKQLGERAQNRILTKHSPSHCAAQYKKAIEKSYSDAQTDPLDLGRIISSLEKKPESTEEVIWLAQSIAHKHPIPYLGKQLFLDVSAVSQSHLKTGIERVARALLLEYINDAPETYRVEPVYLSDIGGQWHYRYARHFTFELLGCPVANDIVDEPIDVHCGDVVIALDLFHLGVIDAYPYFDHLYQSGIKLFFIVFDLLPILRPDAFPKGTDARHVKWLTTITRYHGGICISKSVADDLQVWLEKNEIKTSLEFKVSWFHLGADIENSFPSSGGVNNTTHIIEAIEQRVSFLMVGTIEPRKGHALILAAFEQLWQDGVAVNLVIVGNEGWMMESLSNTLRNHAHSEEYLFWLEGISDEYLEQVYAKASCLIAASEGEGFGLPLIEAAQHKLPIIARDIPVFREVAGDFAFYFNATDPLSMAKALQDWLKLFQAHQHPESNAMPWQTWKQSAKQLLACLQD